MWSNVWHPVKVWFCMPWDQMGLHVHALFAGFLHDFLGSRTHIHTQLFGFSDAAILLCLSVSIVSGITASKYTIHMSVFRQTHKLSHWLRQEVALRLRTAMLQISSIRTSPLKSQQPWRRVKICNSHNTDYLLTLCHDSSTSTVQRADSKKNCFLHPRQEGKELE